MSSLSNKIEASHKTLYQVLNEQKYSVDYFQREYSWQKIHIQQLVTDLTSAFLNEYTQGDARKDVQNYNSYYLGPFVVSASEDGSLSIIDGQQRLTSLTLFLIFLNHFQKDLNENLTISSMIFSEKFGEKTFNIQVDERLACFNALFEDGKFTGTDSDESSLNMAARYEDITEVFPNEITTCFANFIDWLKEKVILVQITAYSDENAYTIFETMNDRGLNLTPSEMLKGFVLSRFDSSAKRNKANELWKDAMVMLKAYEKDEDQRFFQSWLRARYADSIRPGKAGSKNEDFEKIGTRFHSWVRDNLAKVGLDAEQGETFENFVQKDFSFYLKAYLRILEAEKNLTPGLEHVFYIRHWGIAPTLSFPLMLASLNTDDSDETVARKIDTLAAYIETFVVRRSVNFRNFSASSIRYTMYSLVKEIRGKDLASLQAVLTQKLQDMKESFDGLDKFRMHGQNKRFVKFLLARMTAWCEQQAGMSSNFVTYYAPSSGKPFEVEHIWADKFLRHKDQFEQENEFQNYRNRLGGLVLLPRGTNQSYGDLPYEDKQTHYIKENLLVKSLCSLAYENNPNFLGLNKRMNQVFQPHAVFKKQHVDARQQLYRAMCEQIWPEQLVTEMD